MCRAFDRLCRLDIFHKRGAPIQPLDIRVEAAQLGVVTEGALEEIVHAVSVALCLLALT